MTKSSSSPSGTFSRVGKTQPPKMGTTGHGQLCARPGYVQYSLFPRRLSGITLALRQMSSGIYLCKVTNVENRELGFEICDVHTTGAQFTWAEIVEESSAFPPDLDSCW